MFQKLSLDINSSPPLPHCIQELKTSCHRKHWRLFSIHIINPLYSWESLDPRRRNHRQADRLQEGVKAWLQGNIGQNPSCEEPCVYPDYLQLSSVQTKHPLETSSIHKALGKSNLGEKKYLIILWCKNVFWYFLFICRLSSNKKLTTNLAVSLHWVYPFAS